MAKSNSKSYKGAALGFLGVLKAIFSSVWKVLVTFIMVGVITGSIVAVVLSIAVLRLIDTSQIVKIEKEDLSYTSILYVEDFETGDWVEYQRLVGEENRIWVDISQIPKNLIDATIAIEDKRFYDHAGVDWIRTVAASLNMFTKERAVQGGSTIHQQLIKNITGNDAVRVERKVQEIFSALNMDKEYSKETVLEAYLNTIHMGNRTSGVQAAAELYFGKNVSELTLAECASLAATIKNPTKYNPSKDANLDRRNEVLRLMAEQGYITEAERDAAQAKQLDVSNFSSQGLAINSTEIQNYFVDNVLEEVIAGLISEYGVTRTEASTMIYNDGLHIYMTLDTRIQDIVDRYYADYENTFVYVLNSEPAQSAMVIMDANGKVVAMIGGTGEKTENRGFNRATMSKRQPGSTAKPVAVYAPAIEYNVVTYSTVFEDKPISIPLPDGSYWEPGNYYADRYKGRMTVDNAIRISCNTIAVQVSQLVGVQTGYNFLTNQLGVGLDKRDNVPSLAIGAFTWGVSPIEWAGAYQIFANGGYYTKPYSFTEVQDSEGNVILKNDGISTQVIGNDTAMVMNQLLQNVVYESNGTGFNAKTNMDTRVAAKTGTTNENYDHWFVGMTADYVGSIWIGYDRNKTVNYRTFPPPVAWNKIMQEVQKLVENPKSFPVSEDVVQRLYCTVTGNLAGDTCESRATGYYKKSNIPIVCDGNHSFGEDEEFEDGEENSSSGTVGEQAPSNADEISMSSSVPESIPESQYPSESQPNPDDNDVSGWFIG